MTRSSNIYKLLNLDLTHTNLVILSRSVQISLVTHHLPFHKVFQFVRISYHVLVVLDLLVRLDNAEVDPRQVDLSRVLLVSMPNQREMSAEVVGCVFDGVLWARLIMQ